MKVTLIQPMHADYMTAKNCNGGIFKPVQLTMPYLAACTPDEFEVEIYDEIVSPINLDDIDGDIIGITAITPYVTRVYEFAQYLRQRGRTVILGGPHVSVLPEEAKKYADAVVIGEGDLTWPEALWDWVRGELKPYYRNKAPVSLEKLPHPRWDLLEPEHYIIPQVVQASRGCPFSCDFCSLRNVYPTFRTRPVKDVVAEVERISNRDFVFWDDNIIGDPEWAKKLFIELAPLKKRWMGQSTITIARSKELVRLASKSGCFGLFVGLESFSTKSLNGTNKGFNRVDQYKKQVKLMIDHGIGVISGMVYGFDDDTPDSFRDNLEGAIKIGLSAISNSILTPYPGTRLFEKMKKEGRLTTFDWSKYTADDVVFKPMNMTADHLIEGHHWVGRQFYSYPSIMRRFISNRFFYHSSLSRMAHNAGGYWALNISKRRYADTIAQNRQNNATPLQTSSVMAMNS